MIKNIIFDFDSTIINAESIELLIEAALEKVDENERQSRVKRLQEITDLAMSGEIYLGQALRERFALAELTREIVDSVAANMLDTINPKVRETIDALQARGKQIFVFSGGFDEVVRPVTDSLGIPYRNVFANQLTYDENGTVIGVDESNPLFLSTGKVYLAERIKNQGRLVGGTAVVGDGSTDLSIRKVNVAKMFVYFAGSVMREEIRKQADFFVHRFDQLLPLFCSDEEFKHEQVPTSKPVMADSEDVQEPTMRITLFENVHSRAVERLQKEGFQIDVQENSLPNHEFPEKIKNTQVLGIRSKSEINARTLTEFPNLIVIGAYCIGIDKIDLVAAANAGIPVFNAPYSNTRSVAELVVGEIILLMRRVFEKSSAAHTGRWLKDSKGCAEIRSKTVGIVGYGHIGSQISVLLENLGMKVLFHDIVDKLPLGNARRAKDLYDLLRQSDVVTLHVPDTPETRNMIGKKEIMAMQKGAFLVNSSRGTVVDLDALKQALDKNHLAGAAIDVFPNEPGQPEDKFECPLQNVANVILTPHIGGSTQEAQENIGLEVSEKITKFLTTGATIGAVNFPEVELPRVKGTHRILYIHSNVPGVLAKVNSVFARRSINVEGQILQTKENIGYLIVDVNRDVSDQVLELMGRISETIRVRKIA